MLVWGLGVPALAGDARRRLVDFSTVVLPTATEAVGGVIRAGPFLGDLLFKEPLECAQSKGSA